MSYYILKFFISATLIVLISEISKKYSLFAAILASLPIVSILAMVWLFVETKDLQKVSDLSSSIFWFVLPSLTLFVSLPLFLRSGFNFYLALVFSCTITIICYYLMFMILNYFGIKT